MASGKIELHLSDDSDVAYVSLSPHPGGAAPSAVKKVLRLKEFYPEYNGADLYFDLDEKGQLIGIEILE